MPPGPLHASNTSLNDFDLTPGSRPRPSFDYNGRLSQEEYWDYPPAPNPPPNEHFTNHPPYNYSGPPPPPPGGPPYNYDGSYDHHDRHSRSMQRGMRGHSEDYSPSPGIYTH